jgi:uncharacterized membrane protein
MLVSTLARVIHILAGVFWAGTIFFLTAYLAPTALRIPGGGPFLGQLAAQSGFPRSLGIAGALTILSGVFLYWNDSQGFRLTWVLSPTGLTFTLGALAAIGAAIVGGAVQGRAAARMETAKPEERPALQARIARGAAITSALLLLAVIAMASARYV